jgi:nitroimidazol reductase NimA-like FMN-containing flavoprotein (pyridoxamine 5'-phosphate oxidase superfamily)
MKLTDAQLAYLATQRLGRLATADSHGAPQNNPVSFRYNPDLGTIDIGGTSQRSLAVLDRRRIQAGEAARPGSGCGSGRRGCRAR